MIDKWRFLFERITRRMWFRASLYCALGILTALIGAVVTPVLPSGLAQRIGASSVGNILGILATSMLAVTTFSLATMVSAYGTASTTATPRAAKLLIEDTSAQGSLATFIGAFLFSIVGLIALSTGIYGDNGRVVLFVATVAVIILITVTLLSWIEQLSRFGRVGECINLVEGATRRAMKARADEPRMGGASLTGAPPTAHPVVSDTIGYIEYIDMARLGRLSKAHDVDITIESLPGTFATPSRTLASSSRALDDEVIGDLRKAFVVGDTRTYDNDPRYGLVVLTEIALRALSPAINDPGTCIDVIGTVVRLLSGWSDARVSRPEPDEIKFPRVFVPVLRESDMFDDVFPLIAREGAHMLEIGIRLQKAFNALATLDDMPCQDAARQHARDALARAMAAITFAPDRHALLAATDPSVIDALNTDVRDDIAVASSGQSRGVHAGG